MRPRSLLEVAAAVHGVVVAANGRPEGVPALGVSIDSRAISPGDVFVALTGERSDGHRFVPQALAAGAAAAIVRRGTAGALARASGPMIEVDDPGVALLDLARDERAGLTAPVVGITGSTGKTCTKDLTAAVLRAGLRVVASPESFNNEIGLPLTLLATDERTEAVVCEMGARGPGHIRLLCEVARPLIGVVTNVGVAHMELFGSPDALRDAKAELPEALPEAGTAVLAADDAVVRGFARRTRARVVLFGLSPGAEVRAEAVASSRSSGAARFDLVRPDGRLHLELSVPGEHMVPDALAAAAVGWVLGISVEDTARALSTAVVSGGRMELRETPDGVRIVNDAYNANPASMAAAIRTARWMAGAGRLVAVLGHMAELGSIAPDEHARIGRLLVRVGVDVLVVVGEEAREIAAAAGREGLDRDRVVLANDPGQAARAVRRFAGPGDLVLVKASRVAGLERVVVELLGSPADSWGSGRSVGGVRA